MRVSMIVLAKRQHLTRLWLVLWSNMAAIAAITIQKLGLKKVDRPTSMSHWLYMGYETRCEKPQKHKRNKIRFVPF